MTSIEPGGAPNALPYSLPDDAALAPVAPRSPALMAATAALLVALAVVNFVQVFAFPSNAPVEQAINVTLSFTWVLAAIALGVVALVSWKGSRPARPGAKLAFAAVILAAASVIIWLLGGGGQLITKLVAGDRLRYMEETMGPWLAGVPWMLALIFGAISYRRGGRRAVLSIVAVAISVLLFVPPLFSAIVYAQGLSD